MSLATAELPTDPGALRAFALACQAELKAAELSVQLRTLEIEKLKFQIAKLRRMQFGRSSERITRQIEQLALQLEELETGEAEDIAKSAAEEPPSTRERKTPKRRPLPDHLEAAGHVVEDLGHVLAQLRHAATTGKTDAGAVVGGFVHDLLAGQVLGQRLAHRLLAVADRRRAVLGFGFGDLLRFADLQLLKLELELLDLAGDAL